MGTGVRDGDLQRLKANPPRNLHPKHRKPQPRPACDRWLSREGEIRPARGGCPRLGTGGWEWGGSLPENQKQLTPPRRTRPGGGPLGKAAARWEKRRLCFSLCKSGIREVLPASAPHPPARESPRPPVPPRPGAPKRAERCQPTAPSGLALLGDAATVPGALGVGRNCPGDVGEEPGVHPHSAAFL